MQRGLSLWSGPDEKVASDFTSVPDPSERWGGGRSTDYQNQKRIEKEMKKRIVEVAVKVVVAALTAFLTAITTTSCMGHGPIIL
jgi:hypothetical protein